MAIRCDASEAPGLVRFLFDADGGSRLELVQLRRALIQTGKLTAKSAVLIDLRAVITARHTGLHKPYDDEPADVWPICRAFLVTTQAQYALARSLGVLGGQSVINEIFEDESAALEWLAALSPLLEARARASN